VESDAAHDPGWTRREQRDKLMELVDGYPIIITDQLRECRDFYCRWLGFEVVFEADWIVVLAAGGGRPSTVAFMHSRHPSSPPAPAAYDGNGMFITLQVADARKEYERLVADGMRCELDLTDEPWGQRRFGLVDPAGIWVDVVEQIEPASGWWDPYMRAT
jgi:catechol 2,3-dioxygenase-like lactoylglutathione lyase family enzyme